MVSLVCATIFISLGFLLKIYPPKDINSIWGYRTPMSMKNLKIWNIAQRRGGHNMIISGFANLILGIWSIINPNNLNDENIQLIFLLVSSILMIFFTELTLRKNFDKNGIKKI